MFMTLGPAGAWKWRIAAAAMAAAIAGALVAHAPRAAAQPDENPIERFFAPGLADLSLISRPVEKDMDELQKIGSGFADAYRVGDSHLLLKEPDKFRMDTRVGFLKFQYVISGKRTVMRAPLTNHARNIGDDPGKRQGPLEVGLVTRGALRGYTVENLGCDNEGGRQVCRYRLRYAHEPERYELLWIDAARKCLAKRRLNIRPKGELKMEFTYLSPRQFGALWIPMRIEVRNAEGKLAGVTEQSDVKVNAGLDDKLFKL